MCPTIRDQEKYPGQGLERREIMVELASEIWLAPARRYYSVMGALFHWDSAVVAQIDRFPDFPRNGGAAHSVEAVSDMSGA
jgi:hypothetical protein